MRFSTARITPSLVQTPIAVVPSCKAKGAHNDLSLRPAAYECCRECPRGAGKPLTLIASRAYSTWNRRPSGLKVLTPRSYSLRVRNILVSLVRDLCV